MLKTPIPPNTVNSSETNASTAINIILHADVPPLSREFLTLVERSGGEPYNGWCGALLRLISALPTRSTISRLHSLKFCENVRLEFGRGDNPYFPCGKLSAAEPPFRTTQRNSLRLEGIFFHRVICFSKQFSGFPSPNTNCCCCMYHGGQTQISLPISPFKYMSLQLLVIYLLQAFFMTGLGMFLAFYGYYELWALFFTTLLGLALMIVLVGVKFHLEGFPCRRGRTATAAAAGGAVRYCGNGGAGASSAKLISGARDSGNSREVQPLMSSW